VEAFASYDQGQFACRDRRLKTQLRGEQHASTSPLDALLERRVRTDGVSPAGIDQR